MGPTQVPHSLVDTLVLHDLFIHFISGLKGVLLSVPDILQTLSDVSLFVLISNYGILT